LTNPVDPYNDQRVPQVIHFLHFDHTHARGNRFAKLAAIPGTLSGV
jgi:hypothetical protein